MVIDPMLYEKISGKSGDPADRLGAALTGMDKRRAELESEQDRLNAADAIPGRGAQAALLRLAVFKPVLALVAIGVVVLVIVIVSNL